MGDYVSGWNEDFLQDLLDNCDNEGFGAMPNFFCENHLTYRDAPKCTDENTCDFADPNLIQKIRDIQPPPLDVRGTIVAEETCRLEGGLPRGTCNGSLVVDPVPSANTNICDAERYEFVDRSGDEGDNETSNDEDGDNEDQSIENDSEDGSEDETNESDEEESFENDSEDGGSNGSEDNNSTEGSAEEDNGSGDEDNGSGDGSEEI